MSAQRERIICPFKAATWQVEPWRDRAFLLLLTGSAGGGKSRLAAEKVHGFCLRYPGCQALMLRKTRNSMTNSTVLFMDKSVIGNDPRVNHAQTKNRFEYANGSILAYGGMAGEEQKEQIRSIGQEGGVDIAWMEEANAFTEDDFNEVLGRMRGSTAPWRQVILSTNPDTPSHWIYRRLIMGGEAQVYYSGAKDNPANPPEYIATLDMLTGVLGQRLRDGLWVQAEGAVWANFDPALHIIDPFPIPPTWRRFRSIDFGYTNAFVCQWWAMDDDGRLYRYREIYRSQRLVEDHARQILQLTDKENIEATVADWDAEDRATLERHGVYTVLAVKDVTPGLQGVEARLRPAGDGKPRIFFMRDALVESDPALVGNRMPTCTEEEIPGYVWIKAADGRPIKEEPLKVMDHGCDATRYMVMHFDAGNSGPLFLWGE